MTKTNWPLVILIAWLFLFLIFAASGELAPRFCNAAMLEAISKQQEVLLFNCPEFWFNRYQSFAGNLITAGVAGYTLYWLIKQLKATNRQAAVAAAQSLRMIASECASEKQVVAELSATAVRRRKAHRGAIEEFRKTVQYRELRDQCLSIEAFVRSTKAKCN